MAAGAAAALRSRLALWGGDAAALAGAVPRSPLFLGVTALATRALERDLLREFVRYLRTGNLHAGGGVRIGLYDPHLATLGGGERYFLTSSRRRCGCRTRR